MKICISSVSISTALYILIHPAFSASFSTSSGSLLNLCFQIDSAKSKQEHAQNMELETLKGNQDYKLEVMKLASKEDELEVQERIAQQNNKEKA